MTIGEHAAGVVELYDFTQGAWMTAVTLDESNILSASTRRQCCADGAFEIGGAYCATLSMTCRLPGLTRFQIRGARITLRRWFDGEALTGANAPLEGVFYVTDARKTADVFTLSGQDAMGWADTSSYNELSDAAAQGMAHLIAPDGATGDLQLLAGYGNVDVGGYIYGITKLVNTLGAAQTGIPGLVSWEDYDTAANGDYCNQWIYAKDGQGGWYKTAYTETFSAYDGSGAADTDSPRDYYRWIAQLAGGFITAKRNGALTLRQFRQPDLGTAIIHAADMERDKCEIADYTLQLYRVSVVPEAEGVTGLSIYTNPDYAHRVPIRYLIESNPLLDGFCKRWIADEGSVPDAWTIAHNLWYSFYYYHGDDELAPRPFRVSVHTTDRYELGQRIRFPDWQEIGDTQTQDLSSVITGIVWTFRGGTVLSCGGEDSRVMADCIRATKADKAIRELRGRYRALSGR